VGYISVLFKSWICYKLLLDLCDCKFTCVSWSVGFFFVLYVAVLVVSCSSYVFMCEEGVECVCC
jgi:hypothetical protein